MKNLMIFAALLATVVFCNGEKVLEFPGEAFIESLGLDDSGVERWNVWELSPVPGAPASKAIGGTTCEPKVKNGD